MSGSKLFDKLIPVTNGWFCLITKDAVWRYQLHDKTLLRMNGNGIEFHDEVLSVEAANKIIQNSPCSFYEVPENSLDCALLENSQVILAYDFAAYCYSMMRTVNEGISIRQIPYATEYLAEGYKKDFVTEISNIILGRIRLPGAKL